jgi:hypothetical protein
VPEPEAGADRGTAPIGRFKIRRGTIAAESWRSTPTIELALEVAYIATHLLKQSSSSWQNNAI